MSFSYDKRRIPSAKDASRRSDRIVSPEGFTSTLSNSAMASAVGYRDAGGDALGLKSAMEAKAMSVIRPGRFGADYEEPRAEAEADRIGSRFSGVSDAEELKTRMGEALGADFSSVRFHTGAGAASMAAAANANGFTSGRDIYLAGGGFNAATAAHEMVHTIQQGAVQASVPTVSAPAGAVQYDRKKPYKGHSAPVEWLLKSHHEALDTFNEHKNDYAAMSAGQRALWTLKNPLARIRGAREDKAGTEYRKQQKAAEMAEASKLSELWQNPDGSWKREVFNDARPISEKKRLKRRDGYVAGAGQQAVNDLAEATGNLAGDLGTDSGVLSAGAGYDAATIASEVKKMSGGSALAKMDPAGKALGGVALAGDTASMVGNLTEANRAYEQGDTWAGNDAAARGAADMISMGADSIGFLPAPAAPTLGSAMSAGANLLRTGADTSTAIRHGRTQHRMRKRGEANTKRINELEEKKKNGEKLSREERKELRQRKRRGKSIEQLRKASRVHKNEAVVSASGNFLRATGNVVGTGLGAAALVGTAGLLEEGANIGNAAGSLAGATAEGIGHIFTGYQKRKMRKQVVDEELGLEAKIDALKGNDPVYAQKLGITPEQAKKMSRTKAKRLILRSMGFETGKRQEAFNRITERRAHQLTMHANEDDSSEEAAIMKDMFLEKGSNGLYSAAAVAERMGYEDMGDDNPFATINADQKRKDDAKEAAKKKKDAEKKAAKEKKEEEKKKKREAKAARKSRTAAASS